MQLRIPSLLAVSYIFFVLLLAGRLRTILQKYYNLLLGSVETSVPGTFLECCIFECVLVTPLLLHGTVSVRIPMM